MIEIAFIGAAVSRAQESLGRAIAHRVRRLPRCARCTGVAPFEYRAYG
jgi:hypothetical protein